MIEVNINYTVHSVGLGERVVEATLATGEKIQVTQKACVVELVADKENQAEHGTVKLVLPVSFFQEIEQGMTVKGTFSFEEDKT